MIDGVVDEMVESLIAIYYGWCIYNIYEMIDGVVDEMVESLIAIYYGWYIFIIYKYMRW